jgi:hypothetical protein
MMAQKTDRAGVSKELVKSSGKPSVPGHGKPKPKAREQGYVQPSHENTSLLAVHIPTPAKTQLKMIAVESGRTVLDITSEMLNLIFAAYGQPQLAVVRDGSKDVEERLKKLWKAQA